MTFLEIKGKNVMVIGCATGIGLATVRRFFELDATNVIAVDIKPLPSIQLNPASQKVFYHKCDVSMRQEITDVYKSAISEVGHIDIVVNAAGTADATDWRKLMDINLNAVIESTLLAIDHMRPLGGGTVVNISSIAGINPFDVQAIYASSKFGVNGFGLSIGAPFNYERTKVRVITVCPGLTDTPLVKPESISLGFLWDIEESEKIYYKTAVGECGSYQPPEAVANAIIKVCQEAESGTCWTVVDGKPPKLYTYPVFQQSYK